MVRDIARDGLAISVITYGEVMEGALYSRNPAADVHTWKTFAGAVDVLEVTPEIAEVWAEVRGLLRASGQIVGDNDLIIAATALRFGMTVVTRNIKHFGRVPQLEVLLPD